METEAAPARGALPLIGLVLGRIAVFVVTLAGAVLLVQALLWAAPGDPIDLMPNSEEIRPVLEAEWNLDKPMPVRVVAYLGRALQGDLGTSLAYRPGLPVSEVIAGPALRSLWWLFAALVLTLAWGTALAWRRAGETSRTRQVVLLVSIAPVFLLAHLAVGALNETTFWAMNEGYIARPEWFALPEQSSWLRTTLAIVILALGSGTLSEVQSEIENALVRIRSSGYVTAARARGAPVWPHVALNLVAPLTTIASTRAAFFVGGLVILEKVLLLNGIGAILWQAAQYRDYPLAMGITVVLAAVVCGARLAGDTVRLLVDPRLRTEGEA